MTAQTTEPFLLQLGRGSKQRARASPVPSAGGGAASALVLGAACGATASMVVTASGEVAGWGAPVYQELPSLVADAEQPASEDEPCDETWRWVVRSPRLVRLMAMGPHHALAALESGGLLAWGLDQGGRSLGLGQCGCCRACGMTGGHQSGAAGTCVVVSSPREVPALQGVRLVGLATGEGHSLALTAEGVVLSWGLGSSGQLGIGPVSAAASPGETDPEEAASSSCRPTPIRWDSASQPVRAVSVGKSHSLALTRCGRVLSFGSGLYHQLGHGSTSAEWAPRVVSSLEGVGEMRPDGSFSGVQAVACGAWHSVALSSTGDLYGWGWNRFGQLGCADRALSPLPHVLPPVVVEAASGGREEEISFEQVGAGHRYTAAVSATRRLVFIWGCLGLASSGQGCEASGPPAGAAAGTAVGLGPDPPKVKGHEADVETRLSKEERWGVAELEGAAGCQALAGMACGPWHLLLHGRRGSGWQQQEVDKTTD